MEKQGEQISSAEGSTEILILKLVFHCWVIGTYSIWDRHVHDENFHSLPFYLTCFVHLSCHFYFQANCAHLPIGILGDESQRATLHDGYINLLQVFRWHDLKVSKI